MGKPTKYDEIIYPNLAAYMEEQGITYRSLANATGFSDAGLRFFLKGQRGGNKLMIDTILIYTGMKYEEAFGYEKNPQ